jgi:hypothetical protein
MYDFIAAADSDDTEQNTTDDRFDWGHGDHNTATEDETRELSDAISNTMGKLDDTVDSDLLGVLEDTRSMVESTDVSKFECGHEDCGLGHSHPDGKHDIRNPTSRRGIDGFNIHDLFARRMEFVANCHCGANEAAMLMKFYHHFSVPMFNDEENIEGVKEMDEDVVHSVYFLYNTDGKTVSQACGTVAADLGVAESEVAPLGVREALKNYCDRRAQIESQAQRAPIGEETRRVIEANRDELIEVTE